MIRVEINNEVFNYQEDSDGVSLMTDWTVTNFAWGNPNEANFNLLDTKNLYPISHGAVVTFKDYNDRVLFSGLAVRHEFEPYELGPSGLGRVVRIKALGWNWLFSRVAIEGTYTNKNEEWIIGSPVSVTGSTPGVIQLFNQQIKPQHRIVVGEIVASAATYDNYQYSYEYASQIVDDLGSASGHVWWISHDRRLFYKPQQDLDNAGIVVGDDPTAGTPSKPFVPCYNATSVEDITALVNEVTILGGSGVDSDRQRVFGYVGDGKQITEDGDTRTIIPLSGYWVAEDNEEDSVIEVEVNDDTTDVLSAASWRALTVKRTGSVDVDQADVVWSQREKTLEFVTPPPTQNVSFRVSGTLLVQQSYILGDSVSSDQFNITMPYVIRDPSLITTPRIEAQAQIVLNQRKNENAGARVTINEHIDPASLLTVKSTGLNLDEDMIVSQVDINHRSPSQLTYKCTLQRLANIATYR